MTCQQGPCQALGSRFLQQQRKPVDEGCSVGIIKKDSSFLDSPDDDVLQQVGDVYAGGPWHRGRIARKWDKSTSHQRPVWVAGEGNHEGHWIEGGGVETDLLVKRPRFFGEGVNNHSPDADSICGLNYPIPCISN